MKKELMKILQAIADTTGDAASFEQATATGAPTYLQIEHNSTYGGYRLVRVKTDGGAHINPFEGLSACDARLSYAHFYQLLRGIYTGLTLKKGN